MEGCIGVGNLLSSLNARVISNVELFYFVFVIRKCFILYCWSILFWICIWSCNIWVSYLCICVILFFPDKLISIKFTTKCIFICDLNLWVFYVTFTWPLEQEVFWCLTENFMIELLISLHDIMPIGLLFSLVCYKMQWFAT